MNLFKIISLLVFYGMYSTVSAAVLDDASAASAATKASGALVSVVAVNDDEAPLIVASSLREVMVSQLKVWHQRLEKISSTSWDGEIRTWLQSIQSWNQSRPQGILPEQKEKIIAFAKGFRSWTQKWPLPRVLDRIKQIQDFLEGIEDFSDSRVKEFLQDSAQEEDKFTFQDALKFGFKML